MKVNKIKTKMKATKKDYLLLKLQYKKECDKKIRKEREMARVYIEDVEKKLRIVNERANKFKKQMEMVNSELKLREKAEKMELEINTASTDEKREKIRKCIEEAQSEADRLKKLQDIANKEAKELQAEFEKKTEDILAKERLGALEKKKKLEERLQLVRSNLEKIKLAIENAADKRVEIALTNQKKELELELAKIESGIKLMLGKANILEQEISLRKEAISTQEKEAKLKGFMADKDEQNRLIMLKMQWGKEVDADMKQSIANMEAMYKKKIATVKKEIVQSQIEKANYAKKSKEDFEKEKKKKSFAIENEYKIKIEKIKKKIQKERSDNNAFKLKAEESLDLKLREISRKMTSKSNKLVESLKKKLRATKEAKEKILKDLSVNLKKKFLAEKSKQADKVVAAKSKLATLKAEALTNISNLKAKLATEKARTKQLTSSLKTAKDSSKAKEKEFNKLKKDTMNKLTKLINRKKEEDNALVARTEANLAKLNKEFLQKKTELNGEISKVKKEAEQLKAILAKRKEKYDELKAKYKATKEDLKKTYEKKIQIEKQKMKEMETKLENELKTCEDSLKSIKAEVKQITENSKAKVKEITGLKDSTEKRRKIAQVFTKELEDLKSQISKIDESEAYRKKTCESGTPGADLKVLCDTMKKDILALKTKAEITQKKVNEQRKKFDEI